MPLNFNSTSVPSSGSVVYNGVSLSTLKQGSVVIWNKMPEFLYNAGNQYTSWTGGWQQKTPICRTRITGTATRLDQFLD